MSKAADHTKFEAHNVSLRRREGWLYPDVKGKYSQIINHIFNRGPFPWLCIRS